MKKTQLFIRDVKLNKREKQKGPEARAKSADSFGDDFNM